MVKILVIGDPHFKRDNEDDMDKMTEAVLSHAKNISPDLIVNLGDTLHQFESINVHPFKKSTKFMADLLEIAPTVMIIGNHDRPKKGDCFLTDDHPFNSLKEWKNMLVVDKVCSLTLKGYTFLFVPYVKPGRFQEALDTYPCNPHLIFCHQEFRNARMGPILSTEGDLWDTENPYIISGHIHDYDQLQPNILYTGTPIQHGFADNGKKGIVLISLNESDLTHERIILNVARKKILYLNAEDIQKHNFSDIDNIKTKLVIKGDSIKINEAIKYLKDRGLNKKMRLAYDDTTVIPEITNDQENQKEKKSFMALLFEKCDTDDLKTVYREIFS